MRRLLLVLPVLVVATVTSQALVWSAPDTPSGQVGRSGHMPLSK